MYEFISYFSNLRRDRWCQAILASINPFLGCRLNLGTKQLELESDFRFCSLQQCSTEDYQCTFLIGTRYLLSYCTPRRLRLMGANIAISISSYWTYYSALCFFFHVRFPRSHALFYLEVHGAPKSRDYFLTCRMAYFPHGSVLLSRPSLTYRMAYFPRGSVLLNRPLLNIRYQGIGFDFLSHLDTKPTDYHHYLSLIHI